MDTPYWIRIGWQPVVETAEFLGFGHPIRAIIGVTAAIGAIVVLGLFGPEGEEQMGEELRWLFAILIVAGVAMLPTFLWHLFRIPPRLSLEAKTKYETDNAVLKVQLGESEKKLAIAEGQIMSAPAELTASYLEGRHIRVIDLPRDGIIVRRRTFVNCDIYGPAVIAMTGTGIIQDCAFESDFKSVFIPITTDIPIRGAIAFEDCVFRGCRFHAINVFGTADDIERWMKAFPTTPTPDIAEDSPQATQ
ncbi:MAG: hypothetical protein IIC28_11330 [Chloroflexi bacterium]|nr:hypothetical protein [Chloroflexota bacterium]